MGVVKGSRKGLTCNYYSDLGASVFFCRGTFCT